MESLVKAFLGIFFILVIVALGVGVISASTDARNADIFLADAVSEIQASHYSTSVINKCKEDADKAGYTLDVTYTSAANDNTKKFGTARLTYPYKIVILGMEENHTVTTDLK